MDARAIQQQRNRLARGVLCALILVAIACGVGFIDSWAEAVAPEPDYYKILFRELARQHYQVTGTPTVVKEEDKTLEFFENQYNFRNRKLGFPSANVIAPERGLLHFSYVLREIGLEEVSDEVIEQYDNSVEGIFMPPVAVWVYSKKQRLVACFCYEIADQSRLKNPAPGADFELLQNIDRSGVVSIQGSFPDGKVVAHAAYLLPLADCKLENLNRHSTQEPNLRRLDFGLPLLVHGGVEGIPSFVIGEETIARLRDEVAFPFFFTRSLFQGAALPLSLLWLFSGFWRLRKSHKRYCLALKTLHSAYQEYARKSFFHFLFGNLRGEMMNAQREHYRIMAKQQEEAIKQSFKDELQWHKEHLKLPANEAQRIDEALSNGSTEQLRKLIEVCRSIVAQQEEQLERERQKIRDREREIHRLEIEIETIPPEKRDNEAREAWLLYQQARAFESPAQKLQYLKEARKKMPRELKPERF